MTRLRRLLAIAIPALVMLLPSLAQAAAPTATTGSASGISSTGATLNGRVNPGQDTTTYHFEYGTTTAYGSRTADQTANGNATKNASAPVSGLSPSTTYHFRLVASNASGASNGSDMTFTTTTAGAGSRNAVSITASPTTLTAGRATTIAGQVTGSRNGGVQVTLRSSSPLPGAKFSNTATATTDATGHFRFQALPRQTTLYQVVAKTSPPVTSNAVKTRVRWAVSVRLSATTASRGGVVRFSGVVRPKHDGAVVFIQKRTATGSFSTVSKTVLRSSTGDQSSYSKKVRVRSSGTYRVKVASDSLHLTGVSSKKRIRVR